MLKNRKEGLEVWMQVKSGVAITSVKRCLPDLRQEREQGKSHPLALPPPHSSYVRSRSLTPLFLSLSLYCSLELRYFCVLFAEENNMDSSF